MARQSRTERGARRLAIWERYGILIDANAELPLKLPARSRDSESESFKSWCERVLGCDAAEVVVYAKKKDLPAQTRMKRLRETSPGAALTEVLLAQDQIGRRATEAQLARAQRKAEAKLAQVTSDEARVRAASDGLTRRTRTSRLESLAADLEKWVDGNNELDELVLQRARSLLAGLDQGQPAASLIQEVFLFAQRCRTELGRSVNGQPPQEQPRTR